MTSRGSTFQAIPLFLSLCFIASGCGSSGGEFIETDCKPELYKSCSLDLSKGGRVDWNTSALSEGEEYILTIVSRQKVDSTETRKAALSMQSSFRSNDVPAEETQLRTQLASLYPTQSFDNSISRNIPSPSNFQFPNFQIGESNTFYIPNLDDYESLVDGETRPFWVRDNTDPNLRGSRTELVTAAEKIGDYKIHARQPESFTPEQQCLDEYLPAVYNILGRPTSVNGDQGLDILSINIPSSTQASNGGKILGAFNYLDRFLTYLGRPIPDSNYGQYIYVHPDRHGDDFCMTLIHEYQHFKNTDYKVIDPLPSDRRSELQSILDFDLHRDDSGMDEGKSHLFEALFFPHQITRTQNFAFLKYPNQSTRALEYAQSSLSDERITRGYNTLLTLYGLARKGGRLHYSDPTAQNYVRRIVSNKSIGVASLAEEFGESESEYLAGFFTTLFSSFYNSSVQNRLFPDPIEVEGQRFGYQIVARSETGYDPNRFEFHPLESYLPLLQKNTRTSMKPEEISITRVIVPSESSSDKDSKIKIEMQKMPYLVLLTRVR